MARKKNCFVIIGFGPKTDFESGRIIDLDKTFDKLIKPVFDELGINCFRAKEIRHSGIIDKPMYEWIFKADIVIADISTLNPNALYELGVRHALRPNTTIVISENQTKYPFDLGHTLITKYVHLGTSISIKESNRFKKELKATVQVVLKNKRKDSPVYTFLPDLIPPKFESKVIRPISKKKNIHPTFSDLINHAEDAKNNNEFKLAASFYEVCLKFEPQNVFLIQRLALVTYKLGKPSITKSLFEAEKILSVLNPDETTDIETLGLSGSINKRLYDETLDESYLNKSIRFYSKGFYLSRDHYNGINLAYLYTIKSSIQKDKFEMISYYQQGQQIRKEVVSICTNIIKPAEINKRGDIEWILQSLAQAYLGLGNQVEYNQCIKKIISQSKGQFDLDTFNEQNNKMIEKIGEIQVELNLIN